MLLGARVSGLRFIRKNEKNIAVGDLALINALYFESNYFRN